MLNGRSDIKLTRVRLEVTSETMLIWAGLICVGAIILLMFAVLARSQRDSADGQRMSKSERRELEEVAVGLLDRAQQAAFTTAEAGAALAQAEAEMERAWQEHSQANQALEKINAELESVPSETMPSWEQTAVSRAARDAYRRGDLTEEQLRAVWDKVDGWGQAMQARSSEASRMRVEVADAWRRYQIAANAVRMARQRAEIAEVSARALREEAAEAAHDAELAKKKKR